MAEITVVYWRDIPAQVLVGRGRTGAKVQLSERFEKAIDRAAMRSGARGTDDYLAEWRKVPSGAADGDPREAAEALARQLEADYDPERLAALIGNHGREGDDDDTTPRA
ncbi:MAG: virulence factor [Rubellimicrobium sp.]|nr:virulence factor [Rubellimicrobium sp.]